MGSASQDPPPIGMPNSRITRSTAERIDRAMIVLDGHQIDVVPLNCLAAHLAFISLVSMPLDAAAPPRPSVLNMFKADAPGPVVPGLTDWDRAFLESLYATQIDQPFWNQRQELTRRMATRLKATD